MLYEDVPDFRSPEVKERDRQEYLCSLQAKRAREKNRRVELAKEYSANPNFRVVRCKTLSGLYHAQIRRKFLWIWFYYWETLDSADTLEEAKGIIVENDKKVFVD